MLVIRGVNVFPSQIEDVVKTIPDASSWYRIELETVKSLDVVTLKIEANPGFALDSIAAVQRLQREIQAKLKAALSVRIEVKVVEPKSIPRNEGKAKRVFDAREGIR